MPAQKTTQETQQMVGWGTSIANFFMKYIDFMGKSTRSEYWFAYLTNFMVIIPLISWWGFMYGFSTVLEAQTQGMFETPVGVHVLGDLLLVYYIATFIPWIALSVRRFRDAGIPVVLYFLLNPIWPMLIAGLVGWSMYADVNAIEAGEKVVSQMAFFENMLLNGGVISFLYGLVVVFGIFHFVVHCLPSRRK